MAREGLAEKVRLEQRCEGSKRRSKNDISECMFMGIAHARNSEEAKVTKAKGTWEQKEGFHSVNEMVM